MTDTTDHPSRRAGLRDEIAQALEAADYRLDMRRGDLADVIMPVLYREWPWLRAEAEAASAVVPAADRAALRDRIAALFRHPPGVERLGDATPGEIADAVLTVLLPACVHPEGYEDECPCLPDCSCCRVESAVADRVAAETPQPTPHQTEEDPARIDRLRPEFLAHASVEPITSQIQRASRQRNLWDRRVQKLTALRQDRVAQTGAGTWPPPAVEAQPGKDTETQRCGAWGGCPLPPGHNKGRADIPENHHGLREDLFTGPQWETCDPEAEERERDIQREA